MLTPEQKAEIRNLRDDGYNVFQIFRKTGYDPKTIRRYLAIKPENQQQSQPIKDPQEPLVNITLEAGLIAGMVKDKTIEPDYPVLIPVPMEIAVEYISLMKDLPNVSDPELKELGEALNEAIDKAMQAEQSKKKG